MPYHHWQATYKYPCLLNFHAAEIYTDQLLFKHCISQTLMIGSCYVSVFQFLFPLAKSYPATMLSRSCNYFTKEILEYVSLRPCCVSVHVAQPRTQAFHSGFCLAALEKKQFFFSKVAKQNLERKALERGYMLLCFRCCQPHFQVPPLWNANTRGEHGVM